MNIRFPLAGARAHALAFGASLLALAPAAQAETLDSDLPEEITVTATKSPSSAFEHPGSVSVLTKEEIDDFVASSISDLFETMPGVVFSGGPRRNGEMPVVRGLEGEGVLVMFDGVRQSFVSGHDGRFFIEPDLLKAAEVVRGSGSALYGSGALGGVIAFETVDAADLLEEGDTFGLRLKGGYQDVNGEWMTGATLFGRTDDGRLDGVASLSYRNSGDIALGSDASLQSDDKLASGLVKTSFKLSDAFSGDLAWLHYSNDAYEPNNAQGSSTGDMANKTTDSDTYRIGLNFAPKDNNWIDARLTAFKNDVKVEKDFDDSDRVSTRTVDSYGIVIDNRSRFDLGAASSLVFTYGAEYYEDEQVGRDNQSDDGSLGGVPDATAKTTGLFLQADLSTETALGRFNLIPAVRYDSFKNHSADGTLDTDDHATSPKVALAWHPARWLMLFGSYSEAFRAPSFNELFADGTHFVIPLGPGVEAPNYFVPNLDLKPEQSESWEWGAGVTFENLLVDGDRFAAKGSYFKSDVTNLIDLAVDFEFSPSCFVPSIPLPCTAGTSHNANTTNARLDGFELEATYSGSRFQLGAGYSTIDGINKDTGDYVGILSPNRLDLNAAVKLPEIDSQIGARAQFAGTFDKVNDTADERDSYEKFDLYFVWAPREGALKGFRVDLAANNLFDTDYERVYAGVSEPGRNLKAVLSWTGSF
ncbi:MAG: TonB-dependent hemoglobin/transferrin/lactoferrin family receptor [Alphaproteobacteria bacterium]|nr:MAG: TonB-dependent hemoglobin/transferrin/lactoferrin family receptor [Alphaproteobacteria bacterium]